MGLQSDVYNRFMLSVETMEELIRNQNSNDLSDMCPELLGVLFRIQNKFEIETF